MKGYMSQVRSSMPATASTYLAFVASQDASFSSLGFEERRRRLEEHCLGSKGQTVLGTYPRQGESGSPEARQWQ